jgi:hypothetical protein
MVAASKKNQFCPSEFISLCGSAIGVVGLLLQRMRFGGWLGKFDDERECGKGSLRSIYIVGDLSYECLEKWL